MLLKHSVSLEKCLSDKLQRHNNMSETFLRARMQGRVAKTEIRSTMLKLTPFEKETIVRHIFDLDFRRFPPRINDVENMTNFFSTTRDAKHVDIR